MRLKYLAILLVLFCIGISSFSQTTKPAQPTDTVKKSSGAPIFIDDDTLFYVASRVMSFSPEERAKAINTKLQRIIDDRSINPDSIVINETEAGSEISVGDVIIMTVTAADSRAAGVERAQLAQTILASFKESIVSARTGQSLKTLLFAILYTLITLAALYAALWILSRLFVLVYAKVKSWEGTRIPTLKFQKVEILSAQKATQFIIYFFQLIRFIITIIVVYTAASLCLGYFPQTRYLSKLLASKLWAMVSPLLNSVIDYLPNIIVILFLLVIGYYGIKVVKFFFDSIKSKTISLPGFYVEWADPTYKIVRFALIAMLIILMFPYLPGSDSPAFKGVSIFIGLLFSLGSTSIVANIVAGLILTYMRPFQVDDRVKISDTVGDVVEKTILVTRIRTIKNVLITVPNAMVLNSHIINYSAVEKGEPLILHTTVTIGYDAPWKTVHKLLIDAAQATDKILKDPKPFVFQTSLDDFYVSYELNAYTKNPTIMAKIYSDLHQNIQDKFNEAGVEIMSPHYKAMRDGNQTTVPETYLPKTYSPPAFRFWNLGKKEEPKTGEN